MKRFLTSFALAYISLLAYDVKITGGDITLKINNTQKGFSNNSSFSLSQGDIVCYVSGDGKALITGDNFKRQLFAKSSPCATLNSTNNQNSITKQATNYVLTTTKKTDEKIASGTSVKDIDLHGNDYALIITIGYKGTDHALSGVKQDFDNAKKMTKLFDNNAFDNQANVIRLTDNEATKDNILKMLKELSSKAKPEDKVFIYYSGHGSSGYNNGKCESALYTVDDKNLYASELSKVIKTYKNAGIVVAFFDACHSGDFPTSFGSNSRSIASNQNGLTPKFYADKANGGSCKASVNNSTRSIKAVDVKEMLSSNLIIFSAARDDEVAWDDREKGGVATNAIIDCLNNNPDLVKSYDADSMGKLQVCSQQQIDNMFFKEPQKTQHIVYNTGVSTIAPQTKPIESFINFIMDNPKRMQIQVDAQTEAFVNKEYEFAFKSPISGYLSVFDLDESSKKITLLFPNKFNSKNKIEKDNQIVMGKNLTGFAIVGDKIGISSLIVMVTPLPIDYNLGFSKVDDFYVASPINIIQNELKLSKPNATTENLSKQIYAAGYKEVIVK